MAVSLSCFENKIITLSLLPCGNVLFCVVHLTSDIMDSNASTNCHGRKGVTRVAKILVLSELVSSSANVFGSILL